MEKGALWEQVGCCCCSPAKQHSRNKYIGSYRPKTEEQRNLTGNSFKLMPPLALSFPPLGLQTKQPLCTRTQEITICPIKHGNTVQGWNSLSFCCLFCCECHFFLSAAASFLSVTPAPFSVRVPPSRQAGRLTGFQERREGELPEM